MNDGDQAWLLTSAALVQIMTPGLAFFYGGLVSEKAVVSVMMMSYGSMGLITFLWSLIGYSLAFGSNTSTNVVGKDNLALLTYPIDQLRFASGTYDSTTNDPVLTTVTEPAYFSFQLMFAIITSALISGSVVGKIKYWWWMAFTGLWHIFVYCVLAHWVFYWDGWIWKYGALDFAGGLVVHISSGVSGFVLAFWLDYGRPKRRHQPLNPHNVPFILLGAALLWFGWFGFNAGSALAADKNAGFVFTNTQLSAASGLFTWGLLESVFSGEQGYFTGRPTAVGAATGAIVGLVGITPACAFVSAMWSIFIGVFTVLCVFATPSLMRKTGVDDTLDAFACHGVGGMVGSLLTGLVAYNKDSMALTGGFYGGGELFGKQIVGVLTAILYCAVWTTIIYWFLWAVAKFVFRTEIRIPEELSAEPDLSQHGEKGYYTTKKTVSAVPEMSSKTEGAAAPPLSIRSVQPTAVEDVTAPTV